MAPVPEVLSGRVPVQPDRPRAPIAAAYQESAEPAAEAVRPLQLRHGRINGSLHITNLN